MKVTMSDILFNLFIPALVDGNESIVVLFASSLASVEVAKFECLPIFLKLGYYM